MGQTQEELLQVTVEEPVVITQPVAWHSTSTAGLLTVNPMLHQGPEGVLLLLLLLPPVEACSRRRRPLPLLLAAVPLLPLEVELVPLLLLLPLKRRLSTWASTLDKPLLSGADASEAGTLDALTFSAVGAGAAAAGAGAGAGAATGAGASVCPACSSVWHTTVRVPGWMREPSKPPPRSQE